MNGRRDMADGAKVRSESAGFAADDIAEQLAVHPLEHADVSLASFERQCDVAAAIAGAHGHRQVADARSNAKENSKEGFRDNCVFWHCHELTNEDGSRALDIERTAKLALEFNAKGYAGKDTHHNEPLSEERVRYIADRVCRWRRAYNGKVTPIWYASWIERQKRRGRKGEAEKERRKIRNRPKRHIEAKGARSGSVV